MQKTRKSVSVLDKNGKTLEIDEKKYKLNIDDYIINLTIQASGHKKEFIYSKTENILLVDRRFGNQEDLFAFKRELNRIINHHEVVKFQDK